MSHHFAYRYVDFLNIMSYDMHGKCDYLLRFASVYHFNEKYI